MEELLSLKWNNHRTTFIHILGVLRDKQAYTDVTLACDGKFYSVHKLVLSTCSDYFCAMFDKTACKSPVIVLKDIKSEDLEALLDYMYLGEVNVRQSDLASLIKAAENLRIKGLAVPDDEPPNKSSGGSASRGESRRDGGSGSPPAKRKRKEVEEDGREDVRPAAAPSGSLHTPPPSRPKSPVSQRLSPSPHRTSQESPATEDRTSRPLPSPVETSGGPHAASQPPGHSGVGQSVTNQYRSEETPSFVKVEMEEDHPEDLQGDSYSLGPDGYKEEGDDSGGTMNNDLPEFLQAAASGSLASGSTSFPHHSFAGPSGYQPGDLAGWQGDGSSIGFPPHLNFSTSESSSQQNAPGELVVAGESCSGGPGGVLVCPVCGKTAQGRNRRQNMDNHMLTHTGERPFQCTLCSYRASQQGNLKRHVRAVHKLSLEEVGLNSVSGLAHHTVVKQSLEEVGMNSVSGFTHHGVHKLSLEEVGLNSVSGLTHHADTALGPTQHRPHLAIATSVSHAPQKFDSSSQGLSLSSGDEQQQHSGGNESYAEATGTRDNEPLFGLHLRLKSENESLVQRQSETGL